MSECKGNRLLNQWLSGLNPRPEQIFELPHLMVRRVMFFVVMMAYFAIAISKLVLPEKAGIQDFTRLRGHDVRDCKCGKGTWETRPCDSLARCRVRSAVLV